MTKPRQTPTFFNQLFLIGFSERLLKFRAPYWFGYVTVGTVSVNVIGLVPGDFGLAEGRTGSTHCLSYQKQGQNGSTSKARRTPATVFSCSFVYTYEKTLFTRCVFWQNQNDTTALKTAHFRVQLVPEYCSRRRRRRCCFSAFIFHKP